jgi:hypothetical protein
MVEERAMDGILVIACEFFRMERGREAVVTVGAKEAETGMV